MNAITPAKPTKLDQFRMEILPPERRTEMVAGMPRHVSPERFERNLVNALMQNPGLMQLDPRLIFREISKAAALGLYLDPQLGEAYLIEAWNGKAKRKEPQLRIGYRGLIKLGRQSGEITMIYAHEVCALDFIDVDQGAEKKLVHKPKLFTDRGDIVGYYAVAKYKDGDFDFEPLSIPQAHKIRDRSDGWKAFQAGKIKSTPWSTDEEEMAKKTAIRRLAKRVPQSPELAEALRIEDSAEYSDVAHLNPPAPPRPPAPPTHQVAHHDSGEIIDVESEDAGTEDETVDAETGEVIDQREIVTETGEQTDAVLDEATDKAIDFLNKLDTDLANCTTAEEIVEVWNDADPLATLEGNDDAQAAAKSYKRKHTERVSKGK